MEIEGIRRGLFESLFVQHMVEGSAFISGGVDSVLDSRMEAEGRALPLCRWGSLGCGGLVVSDDSRTDRSRSEDGEMMHPLPPFRVRQWFQMARASSLHDVWKGMIVEFDTAIDSSRLQISFSPS